MAERDGNAGSQRGKKSTGPRKALHAQDIIGAKVEIVVKTGEDSSSTSTSSQPTETVTGSIYAYDQNSKTVVLREELPHTTLKMNMRVINTHSVKSLKVIEAAPKGGDALLPLPAIDIAAVEKRERLAIAKAEAEQEKFNAGVSADVQDLFDALSKQYDMVWQGNNMFLTDLGVTISPPYEASCCKGSGAPAAIDRVRKVLRGMQEKLAAREK